MTNLPRRILLFLILLTILGGYLRYVNLSPFKFYPDAYESLSVAENLRVYGSVIGRLGEQGMVYPDFFMWTHPIYPLLINLGLFFLKDVVLSSHIVSLLSGILLIPLTFIYLQKVFRSNEIAISGALLTALSFNHTIWSGFIMTDTTGILFLMLFLLSFFASIKEEKPLANAHDMLSGFLFAVAILTRYKYAVKTYINFFTKDCAWVGKSCARKGSFLYVRNLTYR